MKRIITLILVLALCLALAACGSSAPPAALAETPTAVEKEATAAEEPAAVFPAEYEPLREIADALVREDHEGALALIEEMKPEPEPLPIEETAITKDNFFDYFEYVDLPGINMESGTHRDSAGNIKEVLVMSGFYLKPEYTVAEEEQQDSRIEIEVKWNALYFENNENITVDLENRSYTVTGKYTFYSMYDDVLTGTVYHYSDSEPELYGFAFSSSTVLGNGITQSTFIKDPNSIELIAAEGTLYLTVLPADDGEDDAPRKTVEDLPAAYEPFRDVLEALVNDDFDEAQALIEEMMPEPEPLPSVEVTITKENFLDYFEYVDIPELYIENGTERDSEGNITRVVVLSGFYLRPEYTPAEEKIGECYVNIGIKWRLLGFKNNKNITVDLENRSYTVTGKPSFQRDYDDMRSAWMLQYPGESAKYGIIFSSATILSDGKTQESLIKDPESFELVSAEGMLYLYE